MKKCTIFIGLLLFLGLQFALAQTRQITGTVTSSEDGLGIPGVSIVVKGTTVGTTTDIDGKYTLPVPVDATTLVFTFVGMKTQEIEIGSRAIINVIMETESIQVQEVVVTAVGITRAEKSLGYSVSTVKSDELLKARETNVLNSLSGKVSGVRVGASSGTLGGSSKIQIRGANSLDGNNQPLFVVDGMPIDNSAIGFGGTNLSGADFGNRAGDLNPDDIESMSVLKGAAATALYGARAKNGAIIITTKRGSKKTSMSVEVNSSYRIDKVLKLPEFQNEYAQGTYGTYNLRYTNGWGPKISEVTDRTFLNFLNQNVQLQAYENNVKDFFETGKSYVNSIAVSGGGDNSDYRVNFSSLNQSGVVPSMTLDRYTISVNAGRDFSKTLSARTSFSYINTKAEGRPIQSSNNPNVLMSSIYGLPRTVDIGLLRDNWKDPITGAQVSLTPDRNGNNPYWIINKNKVNNSVERIMGTALVNYKPFPWLSISNNLGIDFYNEYRFSNVAKGTFGDLKGSFNTRNIYNRILNNDLLITFEQTFSDWTVKAIVGHNVNQNDYRTDQLQANELTVDGLYNPGNAATTVPQAFKQQKRIVGLFADITVTYKNFLFLTMTGRNDWSSTLPINNRSYFYPSIGTSLIFTELLPKNDILSFGKVRVNWANVGSDEAPYQLNFDYTAATTYYVQYSLSGTFPHGGIVGFMGPRILPPTNLKPQNQRSIELGSELKFLKDRINLNFTYYNTVTSDQIVAIDVPRSTGFFSKKVNIGEVKNVGFELDFNVKPVVTNYFKWELGINYGKNKQTVEELTGKDDQSYTLASGWSGLQIKALKGETFRLYGTKWRRDPDGNFVINSITGLREVTANQPIGDIYPDWIMGVNNNFSYKNFGFSFLIDIRKGGLFYSGTVAALRNSGLAKETLENRDKIFIDKGVNLNTDGTYTPNTTPVQSMQDFWGQYSATSNTEGNVFDGSFVKLREIRFSYTLPSAITERVRIRKLELGLEGRNLWIIQDHVPHVDPESNFFGPAGVGEGVEFNSVPSTRTFGFNVKLTF